MNTDVHHIGLNYRVLGLLCETEQRLSQQKIILECDSLKELFLNVRGRQWKHYYGLTISGGGYIANSAQALVSDRTRLKYWFCHFNKYVALMCYSTSVNFRVLKEFY